MKSPTLQDVARLAGVSYATTDRVVNRRGNVAEKSVRKVEMAVTELGYVRNIAAANLSRSRQQRLAFVLPERSHPFFGRMHAQLDMAMPHLRAASVNVDVIEFGAFDSAALEDAVAALDATDYEGVAFVGQGEAAASATLNALRAAGTRVVSLVSDGPRDSRDHYIGIDNRKAGRTAARLVGMGHAKRAGRVILAVGASGVRDHGDRIAGFRDVLARDYPALDVIAVIETRDDPVQMRDRLRPLLADDAKVTAIYNAGAGNAGLVEAIRCARRAGDLFCVVHELCRDVRDGFEDGIVDVAIDQRPEIEMTRALTLLRAIVDDLPPPPAPELIPAIHVRDNLPENDF